MVATNQGLIRCPQRGESTQDWVLLGSGSNGVSDRLVVAKAQPPRQFPSPSRAKKNRRCRPPSHGMPISRQAAAERSLVRGRRGTRTHPGRMDSHPDRRGRAGSCFGEDSVARENLQRGQTVPHPASPGLRSWQIGDSESVVEFHPKIRGTPWRRTALKH